LADDNSQDETISTSSIAASVDFDLDGSRTVAQPHAPAADESAAPAPSANHVALPVGFALQEYTIEAVLGAGGFGITYLARDNNLQCQVAIKEYLPNDLAVRSAGKTVLPRTDSDTHGYRLGLERFLAETRVLAGFRHPNIVRVGRFFEANGTAYMVMDYEQGEPLRDWLFRHTPVDEATLKRMFLPLLDGLEVVHSAGVVHRDIKPANIYVRDGDGSLVLLDFGAARQTTGVASKSLTSIITPGYAPFEQYHTRGAQGPWTDLYALAGVLYWLVTGQKPLEAPSRVKHDTMPTAATAAAGRFSPAFLAAIDWGLTVDEEARPRSVAEFRAALQGESAVPARPVASAAVKPAPTFGAAAIKRPGLKFAAVAAGLAVVALLG
jgi:serine/threonine protein kinase